MDLGLTSQRKFMYVSYDFQGRIFYGHSMINLSIFFFFQLHKYINGHQLNWALGAAFNVLQTES